MFAFPSSACHRVGNQESAGKETVLCCSAPLVITSMKTPIFFDFKFPFGGDDSTLRLSGRALCVEEFGEMWMYGVNPGMICGSGRDIASAYLGFRINLLNLALDILNDFPKPETFVKVFGASFESTNQENLKEWKAARQMVRAGEAPDLGNLMLRCEEEDPSVGVEWIRSESPAKKEQITLQTTKQLLESAVAADTETALAA